MNMISWDRGELKERAKFAFQRSYWWCVLAALIIMLITGGGNGNKDRDNHSDSKSGFSVNVSNLKPDENTVKDYVAGTVGGSVYSAGKILYGLAGGVIGLFLVGLVLVTVAVALLLKVLVLNPLEVGGRKFFVENAVQESHGIGSFLWAFKNGYYGNIVVGMFMRKLKIFLWTLLFVVPGIIKAYEYRMVPYILAEHPELSHREALERSSAMMDGQKMNAFILDLSFIGWHILSVATCGLVGIFWTNPYYYATDAELYLTLST